jgi:hypothetical protein
MVSLAFVLWRYNHHTRCFYHLAVFFFLPLPRVGGGWVSEEKGGIRQEGGFETGVCLQDDRSDYDSCRCYCCVLEGGLLCTCVSLHFLALALGCYCTITKTRVAKFRVRAG